MCKDPADHFSTLGSCHPRWGETWPKQVPAYRIPPRWLWGLKRFFSTEIDLCGNTGYFMKSILKIFWGFLLLLLEGVLGIHDFTWRELLENEWSSRDSENAQEQLDGWRPGCLSTAFFLTLTSFSGWGSMKTWQPCKKQNTAKSTKHFNEAKHPAKSFGLLVLSTFQAQRKGLRKNLLK